jgi:glycosyltransferase involved in cell wall biosynthesis
MNAAPLVSIVIPTHNRCDLVARGLDALGRQSCAPATFEVLVVADACVDDTVAMLTAYAAQAPYRLTVLAHEARSAAATRNLGASQAKGSILLFLDDDVIAQPGLVQAHLDAQAQGRVVLGYSKPILAERPSWFQCDARRWWEDRFTQIGKADHRFTYRDFFSGNVSLSAALFWQAGGFDTTFSGRLEDYELGLRLLRLGTRFYFAQQAIGHHHDMIDLKIWARRLEQDGMADIQIGQCHPELRTTLFGTFEKLGGRWGRHLHKLAFTNPLRGAKLVRLWLWQADLLERLRMRRMWRRVVSGMQKYNYWRGVAKAIGSRQALASWLQEVPMSPTVAGDAPMFDLFALPPDDALPDLLAQASIKGARVLIDGLEVLVVPPQLGAEPLRLEHLHGAVRTLAKHQFIPALAVHMSQTAKGSLLC